MLNGDVYTIMWLVIAIVLAVIEATTFNVVTIWFSIGALVALIFSLVGLSFSYQIIIFIVTSGALLYFTRPIIKKYLIKQTFKTNSDRMIGENGIVIEEINGIQGTGQVKVLGQIWSAKTVNDELIEVGELIEVKEISGVKLIVIKK